MTITYLTGPAGTGKTTYAVTRLRELLASHVPASSILVLVPQQTLAEPYRALLRDPSLPGSGLVEVLTLNGLALRTIDLFWPLGASSSGFGRPHTRSIFLNIEQAQYYLRQAIDPLLAQGYFDPNVVPVTISLPRLVSQILDNLNKAALIGLPHTEVGQRLAASLMLEPSSRVALEHTQACVNQFREFCLARNLLDFSLRIEMFYQHLWPVEGVQQFLTTRYRHLIVDNLEEDTPFAHTILRQWLPHAESALLVNDEDAGYRIFLGANWRTAALLAELSNETIRLDEPRVAPADLLAFGERMSRILSGKTGETASQQKTTKKQHRQSVRYKSQIATDNSQLAIHYSSFAINNSADPRRAITFEQHRFYPTMIDAVIDCITKLLAEGATPDQIVVLAPFVSDALRFAFVHRMEQRGLAARSHRPSRPLNEEPAAKTMLTLTRLAFPHWNMLPEPFDVAQALHQAIADLDLVRANLLTQVVYRQFEREEGHLSSFDQIEGDVRERISYQAGHRFDRLRAWLLQSDTTNPPVLDTFLSRLFEEVLTQPGFGFHGQQEAGEIAAHLINSARKFRQVAERIPDIDYAKDKNGSELPTVDELNRAYLDLVGQGMMAAQYIRRWDPAPAEAVLITPATTFLMSNRPVDYQFWLDAGSSGWWERISQPLTHPYILAADWEPGRPWTDADEVTTQRDRLARLVLGLTRRCRKHIYIINAEIGEQGYEQRGQLLMALQQMLRQMQRES
ncbi:MAG: AAA family ATPase [Anaerolineae bacterium]|nr:AAA family ATPase [Anaerolineae bacterium]